MRALLSYESALRYWRNHFPSDSELGTPYQTSSAEAFAHRRDDIAQCVPETYWKEGVPLDVMTLDARHRSWSQDIKCHVWTSALPSNAFYRVGDMLVSSPEFTFLQMAGTLTVSQLVALGCELCGTYILPPREERARAVPDAIPRRICPLTSIESLQAFLDNAKGSRHVSKATRAAKYIVENARSPMESVTVMQLCLPPMLGGYGIQRPTMNPIIHLDETARKLAGTRWCEGDACWTDCKLDLEYNGAIHSGAAQMRHDAGRAIALEHMGWKVITVTSAQVFDIMQFEAVADQVAKRVGHRIRATHRGFVPARVQLHDELSRWLDVNA